MPSEHGNRNRQMGKPDRGCNHLIEDGSLQLQGEEIGIYMEQSRVQIAMNGGEVHAIVFASRMVSGDEYASHGEQCQQ